MKKRIVFGSSVSDLNAFERNLCTNLFYERIEVIFYFEMQKYRLEQDSIPCNYKYFIKKGFL